MNTVLFRGWEGVFFYFTFYIWEFCCTVFRAWVKMLNWGFHVLFHTSTSVWCMLCVYDTWLCFKKDRSQWCCLLLACVFDSTTLPPPPRLSPLLHAYNRPIAHMIHNPLLQCFRSKRSACSASTNSSNAQKKNSEESKTQQPSSVNNKP